MALDVSGADADVSGKRVNEKVDVSEDRVRGSVAVAVAFPAFNNSRVVSVDDGLILSDAHPSEGLLNIVTYLSCYASLLT